jgi:hypothetical protein
MVLSGIFTVFHRPSDQSIIRLSAAASRFGQFIHLIIFALYKSPFTQKPPEPTKRIRVMPDWSGQYSNFAFPRG